MLLLLEQERVRDDRDAADGLAVRGIWEWDAFIVCEVRPVIGALSSLADSGQFGGDDGRAIICSLEKGGALKNSWVAAHATDCLTGCLNRMRCHFT